MGDPCRPLVLASSLQPLHDDLRKSLVHQDEDTRNCGDSGSNTPSRRQRPLRNKSTPTLSTTSITSSKPTNRRHLIRKLRAASTRSIQLLPVLDGNVLDSSSSSTCSCSLNASSLLSPGLSGTMNSSRGSMTNASGSSLTAMDSPHSQLLLQPMQFSSSPRRWKSSDTGSSFAAYGKRSTNRTSTLRQEMSKSMLQKEKQEQNGVLLSLASSPGSEYVDDNHHPQANVPANTTIKSPTQRMRKKRPPSKQRSSTHTHTDSTSSSNNNTKIPPSPAREEKVTLTFDERKAVSVLLCQHLEEKQQDSQAAAIKKVVVGGSMRNLLRSKHRMSHPSYNSLKHGAIGSGSGSGSSSKTTMVTSPKHQQQQQHETRDKKSPQPKENRHSPRKKVDDESGSTGFRRNSRFGVGVGVSRSASTSQLHAMTGSTEMAHMDEKGSDDEGDSNDDQSLVSLDIYGTSDRHNQAKDSSAGSIVMEDELLVDSHTFSLTLDDIQLGDDEQTSDQDSESNLQAVKGLSVMDPCGRRGIYSGLISRSSGMPYGQGRLEYPDKGEIYEGAFVHGCWTGYGRCIYTLSGEDYTGTFLDSVRHGHGSTKYDDGRVFEGTYTNGTKTEGKMTYQDGSTYLGHWSNGARHGRGTYTFANGSVFFGEFEDDVMHGSGILTLSDGSRCVGKWKHGLRDGPGQEFRPNGIVRRQGVWKDGAFVE